MSTFLAALVGALIYRLRGWGPTPPAKAPWWKARPILQVVFALPYAEMVLNVGHASIAALVLTITMGAVLTGHASIIDLGHVKPGSPNSPADGQQNEWYTTWIPGTGYWHDFVGLMVSGLLISAPCALALTWLGHWQFGAAVAASGMLKAPAYSIGWLMPQGFVYRGGASGEVLTGAFLWGSLIALSLHFGVLA